MVVYRSHSNWDGLAGDGVADQAVAALPIKDMRTIARQRFFSVQELPEPVAVRKLASRVEHGLGMPGCRIWGNPWQEIQRFAFLIGGFGANQWNIPQAARQLGAEAIIIGEMTEQLAIAAMEQGMPVDPDPPQRQRGAGDQATGGGAGCAVARLSGCGTCPAGCWRSMAGQLEDTATQPGGGHPGGDRGERRTALRRGPFHTQARFACISSTAGSPARG